MTIIIELPEELASRLAASMPEEERSEFTIHAIADALEMRCRDEAECVAAVEAALIDMDAGRGLISFEDACRQWDAEPTKERLERLARATGRIEGPSVSLESLRRENLYEERS